MTNIQGGFGYGDGPYFDIHSGVGYGSGDSYGSGRGYGYSENGAGYSDLEGYPEYSMGSVL